MYIWGVKKEYICIYTHAYIYEDKNYMIFLHFKNENLEKTKTTTYRIWCSAVFYSIIIPEHDPTKKSRVLYHKI